MSSPARVARGQPLSQVQESRNASTHRNKLIPSEVSSFVRACFTEKLGEVDFTQALTAMEHLKNLEDRRRSELSAAIKRLSADPAVLERDRQGLQNSHPGVTSWIASTEAKSKKVEALYTQVYIGLRRWTLINEMRLTPFNKANCIVMLNTLYPPSYGSQPTVQLTENVLNAQRNAFFRYIQAVEKNGREVLANLENASRRPGDVNGWPVVRDIVDVYLRKASGAIEDCTTVKGEDFEIVDKDKRTDSGVSFSSDVDQRAVFEKRPVLEQRPSTSVGSSPVISEKAFAAPVTPSPAERKPSIGTFERIARELRRIKSRSAESKEIKETPDGFSKRPSVSQRPSLRKMRSTSGLNSELQKKDGKHSRDNSSDRSAAVQFQYTIDEAQREKLIREAQQQKETLKHKRNASPSQFAVQRPQTAKERRKGMLPEPLSPTSCRIQRLDARDPYRLPDLMLPELSA